MSKFGECPGCGNSAKRQHEDPHPHGIDVVWSCFNDEDCDVSEFVQILGVTDTDVTMTVEEAKID